MLLHDRSLFAVHDAITGYFGEKYGEANAKKGAQKMKVCIAGNSGHGLSVLEDPSVLGEISVAGYCRTYQEEDLGQVKQSFSGMGILTDYGEDYLGMLETEKPDIVVIDSVFWRHAELAEAALKRGIHVYCEKPLATEMEELERLKKAAEKSTAKLFAMQSLRYFPCFYTAKWLVDENQIGAVRMINVQKSYKLGQRAEFYKHRRTYGGTIPWVAIHGIDLLLWTAGKKVKSVQAFQSRQENFGHGDLEMTAVCNFLLEDEILANLQADFYRVKEAEGHSDDRLRIVGTKGVVEVRKGRVYVTNSRYDEQEWELLVPPAMFADFLHYIRHGSGSLLDTEASLYTTEVALRARETAECAGERD